MKVKRYLKISIRLLISTLLIGYLVKTQDFSKIIITASSINLFYIILGFLFLALGTLFSSLRWKEILKTSDINLKVFPLFCLYIKGYFYNNFLPTQMGGDLYKGISLANNIGNKSIAFFSVFVDRFAGLIVLILMGIYGLAIKKGVEFTLLMCVFVVVAVLLYFPILKKLSNKIKIFEKFYTASLLLVKNKKSGFKILGYSILVQLMSFSMTYVLFTGFNIYLKMQDVLAFMPLISLSLLLPSFNGWGTQETVFANLFVFSGVISSLSIAVSLLIQVIRLLMSLLGGVFILLNIGKIKKKNEYT